MQDATIFYADHVKNAEGKVTHAIKTLGQDLAPLAVGDPDSGVRQDLINRMLEALCNSLALKAKKGIICMHYGWAQMPCCCLTHCADGSPLMPCMLDIQSSCHWHAEEFNRRVQKIFLQPLDPFVSEFWVESGMTQQQADAKGVPW